MLLDFEQTRQAAQSKLGQPITHPHISELDKNSTTTTKIGGQNSAFNQTTTLTVDNMQTASRNSSFKNISNQINNQLVFSDFNNNKFNNSQAKSSKNNKLSYIS